MLDRIRKTWGALRGRTRWEGDLEAEFASHVEHRVEELEREGWTASEARRRARLELGRRESYKAECREASGLRWPDELRQDTRFALRVLRRSPGFAAVAVLSLALGIGATTVVFSTLNALILRSPLGGPAASTLYSVQVSESSTHSFRSVSYPNYIDLRDRARRLTGLAAFGFTPVGIDPGNGAYRAWAYLASGNYFDLLGVRPALGRLFHATDDRAPGASPFIVLSFDCWQGKFGGDPGIVGRVVRVNALPFTVLGVTPRGFHGTELFFWPEAWLPVTMQAQVQQRHWLDARGDSNLWMIGRLQPGVRASAAASELKAIAGDLRRTFPLQNGGLEVDLARPGLMGDLLRGPTRAFASGVLLLAVLVLLAACANLANLLAARAADRHRELATRLAIGAGRARVLRQLIVESLLLSLLGGGAGCALAFALLHLISGWQLTAEFPLRVDVSPDARVLAFTFAAALVCGLLFSIAPARQAWRTGPSQVIKGATAAQRRWSFRDLLVATQVALCCILVTASFVAVRGLARSFAIPLGFAPRGVAVAAFELGLARYDAPRGRAFQRRVLDAASHLPGVTAAGYTAALPLSIYQSTTPVFPYETADFRASHGIESSYYTVSPDYLRAIGTRLAAGRDFTWRDDDKQPLVAIVNETLAKQLFGTTLAVGRSYRTGANDPPVEVVGVVEDGKYVAITESPRAALFLPASRAGNYADWTVLVVRSNRPEGEMARELRDTITAMDPRVPIHGVGALTDGLSLTFLPSRSATVVLGAFGLLAVMLALTGTYGVAAYAVSRRRREIGIRMAVGARHWQVLRSVLGRIGVLLAAGSLVGMVLGFAASRVLAGVVSAASPSDPIILPAVALTMVAIGLAAALTPARRATGVDPVRVLKLD